MAAHRSNQWCGVPCTSCETRLALIFEKASKGDDLLACTCVPPDHAEETNEGCHTDCVIHVCGRDRSCCGEEQNHTDEAYPCNSDCVDWLAPSSHGEWSWVKLDFALVPSVCDYDGDVADVKRWGGNVKDTEDRQGASDTDHVQAAAKDDNEPDRIDGRVRNVVDLGPKTVSHQPCAHRSKQGYNLL